MDDKFLANLDLVLLDIKSSNPQTYRAVTERDLAPTLRFAERLAAMGKPVWVRFTLVPGFTDDPANVEGIARFVAPMKNVEWVEVQPFHQLGAFKWKAMKLEYKHVDTPTPTPDLIERVIDNSERRLQRPLALPQIFFLGATDNAGTCPRNYWRQPILAAFLAIGLGYLVGQINIFGFSLGVGGVLFVGLAIGAFAPKAQIVGPIGLTGLIMFLYGIGILYGRQFFEGMAGPAGRRYNLLALIAVAAGLVVALGLGHLFGIKLGHTLGIFAGSMTSTATLQAALDVMQNKEPSIGYSIAYPFGVIGPILCIYFMTKMVKPKFPPKTPRFHMAEISLGEQVPETTGLRRTQPNLPQGLQVTMIRKSGENFLPADDVMLVAWRRYVRHRRKRSRDFGSGRTAREAGGGPASQGSFRPRLHQGLRRQGQCGWRAARKTPLPPGFPHHILHVRRYDADMVPTPDLELEFGDRVGVLLSPDHKEDARRFFGDTVKAAAEFSYVSLGIGMVLGVLLGLIPIPIPGVGTVRWGSAAAR